MKMCLLSAATSPHIKRQAVWFARRGHEVHVITFVDTKIKDVNIHYINIKLKHLPLAPISSLPLEIGRIKKIIKEIGPDIVNGQYLTNYGLYAACSAFHPLVLTAWGSDVLIAPKQSLLIRLLTKYSLKKANLIICRSPTIKDEVIKLGANPGKIKLSFPGVNTREFNPAQRSEELRQKLGISDSPAVISTRGLSPIYNVETLIKAVPLVLKEVPPAKFVIAGEGKQRNYLESLAQRLGVSDSVKFVGLIPHNEIPQYVASSDVYVSTSLSDGVPNSLLEAMASGLAPVLTDIAANQLWIKDEENGFLVGLKDYEMLASRITHLLKDNNTRSKFGEMNRRLAREKAEHKIQMEALEKMYQDLIRGW